MAEPKKIKLKSKFLLGRKEHDHYFLSNGIYMFDVTDHLERLPDDVQLAFQLWTRWNKYGKDQPFREDAEEKVTDQSAWDKVMLNRDASYKGRPCPLVHVSADDNQYRGIANMGTTFWSFISEEAYQLVLEIWDESEVEFYIGEEVNTPVAIEVGSQRVGCVAQCQGVAEKLNAWGFPHFLPVLSESAA